MGPLGGEALMAEIFPRTVSLAGYLITQCYGSALIHRSPAGYGRQDSSRNVDNGTHFSCRMESARGWGGSSVCELIA